MIIKKRLYTIKKQIMTTLEFCTNFYKNAYFGGYPTKTEFNELLQKVRITEFIDLTTIKERQSLSYNYEFDLKNNRNISYRNYCILDNKIPKCTETFLKLVLFTAEKIKKNTAVYIHCKGGHGRSSLFVACLFMYLLSYNSEQSLYQTKEVHKQRKNLKDKYKDIEVPSSILQRKYIDIICEKIQHILKKKEI